ncbi:glycosyl hydrolase [Pseudonocardia sichuanensis]
MTPELEALFDTPPPGFGPTPLWWWSGEPVTRERLEWQMRRFHEGGVDDLVVINLAPAGPLFGAVADDPPWFSEAWWDRFRDACAAARSLGMRLWFYDQIGFSGANIQGRITHEHPWATGRTLRAATTPARGGHVAVPGDAEPVAAYTADGRRVEVGADGAVDTGATELLLVTAHPTAFDYLDPAAVDLLLDTVHREFARRVPEYLGDVVVGSFQDELPATNAWTPRFAAEFAARCGYDLLDHLPALFGAGDVEAAKVRSDYYAVRAALTEDALFRPLARWHAEHGLLLGADQSNPARAGLPAQSTQIYTDYFRTHRWFSAVGSDHEGDAKVHSSMAHLYGHDRVWIEAFHSSGWGGTLEDTWDWLLPFLRSGATLYNPHASYYSTVGGWFEWAPPSTDWRQPYWRHYPAFARAVARVAALMSWGRFEADVAVLHPTATMQAAIPLDVAIDHFPGTRSTFAGAFSDVARTQAVYRGLCGTNDWFHVEPSALDAAGIAFDVLDDASLQRGDATGGRLRIREQAYSSVVIPSAPFLEEASARALVRFMDAGGSVVVVGERPRWATGRGGDDAAVAAVLDHDRCTVVDDVPAAVATLPADARYARSDMPLLVRRQGDTAVALVGGAYPDASDHPRRAAPQGRPTTVGFDRSRYTRRHRVIVRAEVARAQVWNPATGERHPAPVAVADGTSTITVETGGAPMVLLSWQEGPAGPSVAAVPTAAGDVLDISDGWTGELVPTLDNTWGDLARPVGADLSELQVWTLAAREEPDPAWRETTATFGQRVLVHRPAAPTDLPPPLDPAQCLQVAAGAALATGAGWSRHEYSASRGVRRDHAGALGTKGRVPVEHVLAQDPGEGRQVVVRALLVTGHRGPADLVLTTSAPAQVWWNGQRLPAPAGETYVTAYAVDVDREVNVVEYRVGASRTVDLMGGNAPLGSAIALAPPGGCPPQPEYMAADLPGPADGTVVFEATVPDAGEVRSARLVVGSAAAATVLVDGTPLARQEKVEYYESERGANPAFFGHDLTGRVRGGETLTVALATTDPDDVVVVDLAVTGTAGTRTLVSGGTGWTTATAGRRGGTRTSARQWSPLEPAHAVTRPHPLPGADWLNGPPQVGEPVLDVHVTDSAAPARQEFRVALPAGTREVAVPLLLDAECALEGVPVPVEKGVITLDAPLPAPATLSVRTEPTAVRRGGAAWAGPALVRHEPAPIALGDWRGIGLGAWSGAVRYRRTVDLPAGRPWTLDLGDLRGSVDVRVNGTPVGEAFCAPFRFALPPAGGQAELEITVAGTLGPFLHESTPTTWVFPTQLASGLFGPVTVHVA